MNAGFAGNSFVIVGSTLVLLGYFLQSVAAFTKAKKLHLISDTFSSSQYEKTWLTVATIFFGPLIISWVANADQLITIVDNNEQVSASATLISSMLLIFVTLEFGLLSSLSAGCKTWQGLITIALMLDIATVIIVAVIKNISSDYLSLVYPLGTLAFVSSFMIILFAYISGAQNETRKDSN